MDELIWNIVVLGVSSFLMGNIGWKYGFNVRYSAAKALLRAVAWSCLVCWSLTIVVAGHGGGALPLPSIFSVMGKLLIPPENYVATIPHFLLSPLIPILCFIFAAHCTSKHKSAEAKLEA